jgi:AhpD family alkylhydroperoxidase
MTQRLDVVAAAPDAYAALSGVERYLRKYVDHTLYELVKLRASMINGCAFCIDMHSTDALASGETTTRLFGLAAWWEYPVYTEQEQAALALTDAVTRLGEHGVPDDVWDRAAEVFDEKQLADLLVAIGMINLWNRISIPSRKTPASVEAAAPAA